MCTSSLPVFILSYMLRACMLFDIQTQEAFNGPIAKSPNPHQPSSHTPRASAALAPPRLPLNTPPLTWDVLCAPGFTCQAHHNFPNMPPFCCTFGDNS
ncbi:hypothetical protein C8R44DRAFT_57855 [Mycena epipterygia]|nr:hypothetical protein C8R44DRAFT_57855 [Mycena epipterygia]